MAAIKKKGNKPELKQTVNPTVSDRFDYLHQVAFWGLALLLIIPPYLRGLFFAPQQEMVLLFAALVWGLVFLWRWQQGERKIMDNPLDYWVLALPLVYLLTSLVAVNKGLNIEELVKNTLYVLVYWSVSRSVRNITDVEKVISIIYAAAVGVALAGLAVATGIIHITDGFVDGRIFSTLQYPNALASYMGAAVIMGAFLWNRSMDNYFNETKYTLPGYLYTAGTFLLLTVFWGTKSRGGFLVFGLVLLINFIGLTAEKRFSTVLHLGFLGVLAYLAGGKFISLALAHQNIQAWLWLTGAIIIVLAGQYLYAAFISRAALPSFCNAFCNGRKATVVLAIIVVAIVIAGGLFFAGQMGLAGETADFNDLKTAFYRLYYIQTATDMIMDRPILGWGGGGWQEAYHSYINTSASSKQVHSYYIQLGVETGLAGLLVVAGIWVAFLMQTRTLYRGSPEKHPSRQLAWLMAMVFFIIAGHAVFDFNLSISALTIVLWAVLGIVSGLSRRDSLEEQRITAVRKNYIHLAAAFILVIIIIAGCLFLIQSRSLMMQGVAYYNSNQVEKGLNLAEKAVQYHPFKADYRVALSQMYFYRDRPDEAFNQARKAVELSQYSSAHLSYLADVAQETGKLDIASESVIKTMSLNPNQLTVYENAASVLTRLGTAELRQGNLEQAEKYFVGSVAVAERLNKQKESISDFESQIWRGLRLRETPKLKLYNGQALYWLGEFDTAEQKLNEASEDNDLKAEVYLYLALIAEKSNQYDRVELLLAKTRDKDPDLAAEYGELKTIPTLNNN